jgi:hypothetical protein
MDNITAIAQMLSEEIQQELTTEYTLTDIERVTRRLVKEIGRQAVSAVVNAQEKPYPEPEVSCPRCSRAIPYVRQRSTHLRTLFGGLDYQ